MSTCYSTGRVSGDGAIRGMTFAKWLSLEAVFLGLRGEADIAVDDGIPNLLKYASGLHAMTPATTADLMNISNGTPDNFSVLYYKSKSAVDVMLAPVWASSLPGSWYDIGVTLEKTGESGDHEIWKATIPKAEQGFIRLRATLVK